MSSNGGVAIAVAAGLLAIALVVRASMQPSAPPEYVDLAFTVDDMAGAKVNLASFKGKPLVINLWATWCGPCRLEMPQLEALSVKFRDRGLTIVGLSLDDEPDKIRKIAEEYKITYPMLVGLGQENLIRSLGYQDRLPLSIVIRADGSVAERVTGIRTTEDWERKLRRLF